MWQFILAMLAALDQETGLPVEYTMLEALKDD